MRGLLKVLLGLAALLALALAALPWWLGLALRPVGARYGLHFGAYERVGYTRFTLREVRFERPNLQFTAKHTELDTPLRWLLRRASVHAEIRDWQLTLLPAPRDQNTRASSPATAHAQARRTFSLLQEWLPHIEAQRGSIDRGDLGVNLSTARWDGRAIVATGALPAGDALKFTLSPVADRFDLTVELPTFAAGARLAWSADAARGTGTWWQQPFSVDATFASSGWIPAQAELRATNWDLAASQLKLAPSFSRVRSDLEVRWRDNTFALDARIHAVPTEPARVPPLDLVARVSGDRTLLRVDALQLDAPFAKATLTAPFEFRFDGRAAGEPARLQLTADLAAQPWLKATGRIAGEIQVVPVRGQSEGRFALRVADLEVARTTAKSVSLRGDWKWPTVNVTELVAQLDESSRVTAHGALDWGRRELSDVRVVADIAAPWAQRWLPRDATISRATATIEAEGPLEAPRHRGELAAQAVSASRLRPIDLEARWTGQERTLQEFTLTARNDLATLEASGLLDERRGELRSLTLTRRNGDALRSVAPVEFTWRPVRQLSGLRLEGGDRSLAADILLGDAPTFFVSAQNLSSAWVSDWWAAPLPPSRIDRLTARGEVRDGVLAFTADLAAAAEWEGAWIQGRLAGAGDNTGTRIESLEFSDERGLMAYASGRLPARLAWSTAPRVVFDENAPLELDASVAPDSPLWPVLAEKVRLEIEGASLVASASGTLRKPRGVVRAEATRLARRDASEAERAAAISEASLTLRAERDCLQLESLSARVAGQPVLARGRLAMDDAAWTTLIRRPVEFDWARASAELAADRVQLAALAQTFPALPLTGGEVEVQLQFARGELTGRAQLIDGETRPLPGLGRMLDVAADLSLQGRRVEVREFAARLGGEPVRLAGNAELGPRGRPVLDLRLEGTNVPLVRRPGLLVRTDVDLRAETPESGPTRITGRVDLRDALVMADLAAILPGGPRGAARHPPYFAVETEPFSRWPLDVRIGGSRSVRMRTAVFNGVATPNFHLTGTLGDPRAIGQLAVDDGRVLFPFASFAVQQGTVRLTAADPTQPQLAVNAAAKRMGYELRLEAGGTVAAPTLAFSSNPPLESAAILLLVTTGQPPTDEAAAPTGTQRLTRLGTFLGRGIFQNFGGEEQRLEITSGEQVSRAGRETYRVEYKLREKLSLTGEYDEYDSYNAGIKYRIYTQEGAKREERK